MLDDATLPDRRGSLKVDDEGCAAQRNVLIENGILNRPHPGPDERPADGRQTVFSASEAYWVENGKIQYPVKEATIIGNDLALDSCVGLSGKEGQSVPVGVGQSALRVDGLAVVGTA